MSHIPIKNIFYTSEGSEKLHFLYIADFADKIRYYCPKCNKLYLCQAEQDGKQCQACGCTCCYQCRDCKDLYQEYDYARIHCINFPDCITTKGFFCKECNFQAPTYSAFTDHICRIPKQSIIRCEFCVTFRSNRFATLRSHIIKHMKKARKKAGCFYKPIMEEESSKYNWITLCLL